MLDLQNTSSSYYYGAEEGQPSYHMASLWPPCSLHLASLGFLARPPPNIYVYHCFRGRFCSFQVPLGRQKEAEICVLLPQWPILQLPIIASATDFAASNRRLDVKKPQKYVYYCCRGRSCSSQVPPGGQKASETCVFLPQRLNNADKSKVEPSNHDMDGHGWTWTNMDGH